MEEKYHLKEILIACDTIIIWVQGFAGRYVWPDPCLEPEMLARCRVRRARHGRPAPVAPPWCEHSGVNAAFCTLFNGSGKNHLAYAAYFGPFSTFQPALSSLGLSSKKKCSNEMLDKIKAILRDT